MHHYFSLHAACLCIQFFNWVKDFFDGHVHCTECRIDLVIRASVIQGSGPRSDNVSSDGCRPAASP